MSTIYDELQDTTDAQPADPNQEELFVTDTPVDSDSTEDETSDSEKKYDYPAFEDVFPEPTEDASKDLPDTYEVERGDTIRSISARFGVSPGFLITKNGLDDPNLLKVGTSLSISDKD